MSLVDGPFFWTILGTGISGAIYLLWRRSLRWVLAIASAFVIAIAVVGVAHWLLVNVLLVFPEDLPGDVLVWSVIALAALALFLFRLKGSPWHGKLLGTASVLAVVLLCALQVNRYFGLNHTVADLLGHNVAQIPELEPELRKRGPGAPTSPTPPGGEGLVRRAAIPGPTSGFNAREAFVYLPPAYFKADRGRFPVLVLFAGQPGRPADWLTGGMLEPTMNSFAANNGGMAPVVVVVDPNGSDTRNTMCMDSRIARAESYLAVDVPQWIRSNLHVSPDARKWAVGGFSFGATCAMQMVTLHPETYSAFIAFSAEREPSLGPDRNRTVDMAFGGDIAAFDALTPLNVMKRRGFSGHAGVIAVGGADGEFTAFATELAEAAREAGFDLKHAVVGGAGHSWAVALQELPGAMDFLAARWGLAR
ncbi:alpha/beta hydrolase [bacterium RCC_150]